MTSLRARATSLAFASALLGACSSPAPSAVGGDASVSEPAPLRAQDAAPRRAAYLAKDAALRPPLELVKKIPALAGKLDPDVHLARVAAGFRMDGFKPTGRVRGGRFAPATADRLVATVPARSTDPVHVGVRAENGGESAWIEILAEDARSAAPTDAKVEAGAVVFRDALDGDDLLHVVEPSRVEELRVVRAPKDEVVTRHAIRGQHVRELRAKDGYVEVIDDAGTRVLRSDPIVAYDAEGTALPTTISIARSAGGWTLETKVDAAGRPFPITIDPTWTLTLPDLPHAHDPGWAVPYTNGKVILAGSSNFVDVFDPYAQTAPWSTLTQQSTCGGYATPLLDGTILFTNVQPNCWASGTGYDYTASAIYNPAGTGTMTRVGDLPYNHQYGKTQVLSDGRVIVFGQALGNGNTNGALDIYNPGTKTWSNAVVTPYAYGAFGMAALDPVGAEAPPGKVLIAGGGSYSGNQGTLAFLFDAKDNSFVATGSLHAPRNNAKAQKLASGKVLLFGGYATGTGSTAELYDPTTGQWTALSSTMGYVRVYPGTAQMPDGKWLIIGGYGYQVGATANSVPLATTEIFNPADNTFSPGPTMAGAHEDPAIGLLPGGRLLIAGGAGPYGLNEPSEVYTPDPVPSTDGTGCPSGVAADGYCCDRACTGTCEACNLPGKIGVCTPVTGTPPAGHGSCAPFLCGGMSATTGQGVCATKCGSDAGCSTGNYCDVGSGQCVPLKAQASGCSRAGECASGFCVDGFCCGSACNAKTCQACDVAGSVGTCTDVASGDPHGTHGSCGTYACVAGACASGTCTGDAQCATHDYCVGGACVTALGQGSTCVKDAQCQSGHCVDGYCCDSACGGSCQACDVGGSIGKCTNVASGAPHGTRTCAPYAKCSAGLCASTCSTAPDCTSGNACAASSCIAQKANGAACAQNAECASGTCADGVCCNTACSGACQACNLTGSIGTCTAINGAPDPHGKCATGPCADVCKSGACGFKASGTACGASTCTAGSISGQICDGSTAGCGAQVPTSCPGSFVCASTSACKTSCASNADCTVGTCDTATGLCVNKPLGGKCATGGECASGTCADGVCCNSACGGACQACNLAGSIGTCKAVDGAADPHGLCPTGGCADVCKSGACGYKAAGTACGPTSCAAGLLTGQACTGASPSCPAAAAAICPGEFACASATACKTSCASDADCQTGHCDVATGLCMHKPNGSTCASSIECTSGTCADGVCCDKACGGACQACNLAGSKGTCTAVDGAADPHGLCAAGPCADACKAGACGFKPATTVCGTASCATGVLTTQTCDGASAGCNASAPSACAGHLACASATACKSSCLVDGDCTSGVCDVASGACVAAIDAGVDAPDAADTAPETSPDTGADDTSVDTAVDTGAADTREIAEVGAPKLPAQPTVENFQRCNKDAECKTGHCVEGVCCDTECKEACHSCALITSPGICTLEPIGVDLKNDCGPGLSCLGTCGGKGECIGAGPGTQCARNRCTSPSTGIGAAYCPAPGVSCATDDAVPFDCGAYACEPAFGACLTSCGGTQDCAPGKVCDVGTKTCVTPATDPGSDSGCAVSADEPGRAAGSAGVALAFVALGLARARRRRARGRAA
jgi:hypothetical protein